MTVDEYEAYCHPSPFCECDCHSNPYGGHPCRPITDGKAACCIEAEMDEK